MIFSASLISSDKKLSKVFHFLNCFPFVLIDKILSLSSKKYPMFSSKEYALPPIWNRLLLISYSFIQCVFAAPKSYCCRIERSNRFLLYIDSGRPYKLKSYTKHPFI